jgi:prepilin-type N-terminal cleavage/methylation domain-containing protein/prepilin-type processing-associated H-X9-DG protein
MNTASRTRPAFTRGFTRAFTLVELLVVIGIIAILISVLLPVLSQARRSSEKAKCLAALHQIGDAYKMYQVENKGAWPVAIHFYLANSPTGAPSQRDKRWHDFVAKYLIQTQRVNDGTTNYTSTEMNANGTAGFPQVTGNQGEFGTQWDPVWIGTMRDRNSVLWGCPSWKGSYNTYNLPDDRRIPGYTMNWFPMAPDDLKTTTGNGTIDTGMRAYINENSSAGTVPNPQGRYFKMTQWKRASDRVLLYDGTHPVGYFSVNYVKFPWTDDNFPAIPDVNVFSLDYNRHGKRRKGSKPREASMNVLYCDGHAMTVSCLEAYKGIRFTGD